ncbi:hypothetical protein BWQ96_06443 [Gracilariopsis chorda]|uniref:Uncharacterized protein n=1 Tax=Gracilariopsis chorda TaxID=448386 RepID=A0A2V3IP22_9FLOR|nr:hypothetical protein BWQ96_06443 [Gracilariopsis chorda]|eukprot:PXF43822.1 hypothetical protein BWQ96_06443 [Gracilariopsis chorda]
MPPLWKTSKRLPSTITRWWDPPRVGRFLRPMCHDCDNEGIPKACCRAIDDTRQLTPPLKHAISRVFLHPDVYKKPSSPPGTILERTIKVLHEIVRLQSTYYGLARLELKRLSLDKAHTEENIRKNWQRICDKNLEPLVSRTVTLLEVLVEDFRTVEIHSAQDAADFFAGRLDDVTGTLQIVILLLTLVDGRETSEKMLDELKNSVRCYMNGRFQHSPQKDKLFREEVDRLAEQIKSCGLPLLHYMDIRHCVKRSLRLCDHMRDALAIQACGEAGYEAVGDKWIREITAQLSDTRRGAVITPTPTSRSLMITLTGRLLMIKGTPVYGLPTGDRWFAKTQTEFAGGDCHSRLSIISELNFKGRHMVRQPLGRSTIESVPKWMTKLLLKFIRGEHNALNKSYTDLMRLKNTGHSPDGEESAKVWEDFFEQLVREEGKDHARQFVRSVNMRAMVGIATQASSVADYSKLFAERMIASFNLIQLIVTGHRWKLAMTVDDAGRPIIYETGVGCPSDMMKVLKKTLRAYEADDNPDAKPPSNVRNMMYAWPADRAFLRPHVLWKTVARQKLSADQKKSDKKEGKADGQGQKPDKEEGEADGKEQKAHKEEGKADAEAQGPDKEQGKANAKAQKPDKEQGKANAKAQKPDKEQGKADGKEQKPDKKQGKAYGKEQKPDAIGLKTNTGKPR